MEKGKKKVRIKYLLIAGLMAFVCIHYRSFLEDALAEIRMLSAGQLWMVILLAFGYQLLEGRVIWLMMRKYVPDYCWKKGVRCALVCSFYRFATLGSGGMAAEIVELSKDGADPARAGGMAMVQYLFHKIMITLYGIAGFFWLLIFTDSNVKQYRHFLWIGTVMTGLIAAFLILICTSRRFSGLCFWLAGRICGNRWGDKVKKVQEQIYVLQKEARSLLGPENVKVFIRILLLNLGKLSCWYLVPWVVLSGKTDVHPGEIIALTASAQMLAGVIPAPAGIGSLEFVFLLFSTKVVEESCALTAMLLLRAAINLIPFVPGMILSILPERKNGQGHRSVKNLVKIMKQ